MPSWSNGQWGNTFFDPNSQYGGTWAPGDYASTGAAQHYFGQFPEASWTRYAGELGLDPFSNQGQFARGLFPQVMEGFMAANATNPNLRIQDYVRGIDINALFSGQTARQRGENPGQYAPRARTISRGYGG
jgi:hypothetical protein